MGPPSAIGAGVWIGTGSSLALPAALGTKVLIDADHAVDYYAWYVWREPRRWLGILHSWEVAIAAVGALLFIWYSPVALAAVLGYIGHLAAVQIYNSPHPLGYSMAYKAWSRAVEASLRCPLVEPRCPFSK